MAGSVDLVVHLGIDPGGRRRVREILGVPGRVEGAVIETISLYGTVGGRLVRGSGHPPWEDRFARHGLDLAALLAAG